MNKLKRSSNIELLRIVSMFLVLVVHADFYTFGEPTIETFRNSPYFTLGQYFFEAISICCVNVFVMISGWFGIHPKLKSFLNFIFQCLFFSIGIYITKLLLSNSDEMPNTILKGIAECLFFSKWHWFIKAYIGLYIISPVLNLYVKNVEQKSFSILLLSFFLFQTIYSWINGAAEYFLNGYSTMSFIGLYLFAQYIRLYHPRNYFKSSSIYLLLFFICVFLLTGVSIIAMFLSDRISPICLKLETIMFSYVNPIVILMSAFLLLYFLSIQINNKVINKIAYSSFAVLLIHANPHLCDQYFCRYLLVLSENTEGVFFLLSIFAYLLVVFIIAVLVDQIRIFAWKQFLKLLN